MSWIIVKSKMRDGTFEYQVSDGKVGERTVSYDFKTLAKARNFIRKYTWAFYEEYSNDQNFCNKRFV